MSAASDLIERQRIEREAEYWVWNEELEFRKRSIGAASDLIERTEKETGQQIDNSEENNATMGGLFGVISKLNRKEFGTVMLWCIDNGIPFEDIATGTKEEA